MTGIPSALIGDFENTLSFPGEETSLDRGGFPHISLWEISHAHPALHTVFSTTQLCALNNAPGFLTITEMRVLPHPQSLWILVIVEFLEKSKYFLGRLFCLRKGPSRRFLGKKYVKLFIINNLLWLVPIN